MRHRGKPCGIYSVLLVVSCAPNAALAQASGRVTSIEYHAPIQKATVRILRAAFVVETDSEGRFEFSVPLNPGCHRLVVKAIGYGWTVVTFGITSDRAVAILGDVPLRAAPVPEWPLLLVNHCDSGPFTKDDAPWGVDTLPQD